jgi:hypothetical protein
VLKGTQKRYRTEKIIIDDGIGIILSARDACDNLFEKAQSHSEIQTQNLPHDDYGLSYVKFKNFSLKLRFQVSLPRS